MSKGIKIKPSKRNSLRKAMGAKADENLSVAAMRKKLSSSRTSPSMKKKLNFAINARSWKKQDGGIVEYGMGGPVSMILGGIDQGSQAIGTLASDSFSNTNVQGQAFAGALSNMAKGPFGMLSGAIQGNKAARQAIEQNRLIQSNNIINQQNQLLQTYPNGGIINQLNNTINPTSTNSGDPNALYEVSKRYGRTRLQSTKDAGQNTTNKRLYYNVRDINTGVARDLSLDEMMLQFPNYTDTPGLGAYPMGGKIPYGQPNAELEKEEVTAAPDGSMAKFDLPTHGNATDENQMALEPGTRVFSDRLKASTGKTFAEEADKIRKEIMKYEKILYS